MKIILLGKDGQLGKEIYINAQKNKHNVIGLSREDLDLSDKAQLEKKLIGKKADVLINATGYMNVADSEDNPMMAFLINSIAVRQLAVITEEMGAKFVNYSSDYVFDGAKGTPYKETDIPSPLQVYGFSKYCGELMAASYNKNSYIIRTCGIYGGSIGARSKGNFVLNLLRDIKDKKEIEVSSEQIVSPTYATELAKKTLSLIEEQSPVGIYHLVNEGKCSWAEFSTEIIKLAGLNVKIIPVNRKGFSGGAKRPIFSALQNTKAKKLGITLPEWQVSLKDYIGFLTNN